MALSKPGRKPLQELNGKTGWCVEGMKKAIESVVTVFRITRTCSAIPANSRCGNQAVTEKLVVALK